MALAEWEKNSTLGTALEEPGRFAGNSHLGRFSMHELCDEDAAFTAQWIRWDRRDPGGWGDD
jgi:hypothetical protein